MHPSELDLQPKFPLPVTFPRLMSLFTSRVIPPSMRDNSSWKCAVLLRNTAEFRETYQRDL
jgi:hypothetical protein